MHVGRKEAKKQRLRVSAPAAEAMAVKRDGSHSHLSWHFDSSRGFSTATEAEDPVEFCKALSMAFSQEASRLGDELTIASSASKKRQTEIATAVQKQPKRSRNTSPNFDRLSRHQEAYQFAKERNWPQNVFAEIRRSHPRGFKSRKG